MYTNFEDVFDFQEKYKYLAHVKEEDTSKKEESLQEHVNLANEYFQKIVNYKNLLPFFEKVRKNLKLEESLEKEIYYSMIYDVVNFHDFGKINSEFQISKMKNDKVLKMSEEYNIGGVNGADHSFLSANIFIAYYFQKIFEVKDMKKVIILLEILFSLSYCISKHHGNLDNFKEYVEKLSGNNGENILNELCKISVSSGGVLKDESLKNFLEENEIKKSLKKIEFYIDERENFDEDSNEKYIDEEESMSIFTLTRMMFSLLVASDYYSTNEFMQGQKYEEFGDIGDIDVIKNEYEKSQIVKSIREREKNNFSEEKDINYYRTKIFLEAEKNLEKNKNGNIFFLEAPTGSGKSNTALNLSLKLLDQDKRKIFYVYPFNTLVEQNMNTLKEVFINNKEVLDEIMVVNSVTPLTNKEDKDIPIEEYNSIFMDRQFFNYPFIITTHVSIFDILVGNTKENCMPFYQLANSVIVFDEIQAYRSSIWSEIIKILSSYAKLLNIKIIIMSATLPDLSYLLKDGEKNNIVKLIENRDEYFDNPIFKNRVELNYDLLTEEKIEYEKLMNHMIENSLDSQKILVEFMTKKNAKEFYELCKCEEKLRDRLYLLTSEDNKVRRNLVIKKMKEKNKKIILISTQLIEAGVDIDVDVGYKNISFVDNEEQFLGRINRSCKKKGIAYFFNMFEAKKIYKTEVKAHNDGLNLFSNEMREILNNKDFEFYFKKLLKILKNKSESSIDKENFENLIFEKNFKALREKMTLIDGDNNRQTYFFNRQLSNEEIKEIGEDVNGSKVWQEYINVLKETNYAKMKVELSKIKEKMSYFLYEINRGAEKKLDLPYNDKNKNGSIIYIEDGDKYFEEGVLKINKEVDIFI